MFFPTILITGGRGFIGSNFVRQWLAQESDHLINMDALTYAAHSDADIANQQRYQFVHANIADYDKMLALLQQHKPRAVINFAAESHVDRSISAAKDFIDTNIYGTFQLLQAVRAYWENVPEEDKQKFRFLHISTDEVFGSLADNEAPFHENTPYRPNSPYSASKAASDHLVRAWHHTYGLPVLITNCSNNYGPYQFPEKLIPLVLSRALHGQDIPVYGDGQNVRDWLYVTDHCDAIRLVLQQGTVGEVYAIGGNNQVKNIDLVQQLCTALDILRPRADKASYARQIKFVTDRAGHDRRYAIDTTKIKQTLGWQPKYAFEQGLRATIQWYLQQW